MPGRVQGNLHLPHGHGLSKIERVDILLAQTPAQDRRGLGAAIVLPHIRVCMIRMPVRNQDMAILAHIQAVKCLMRKHIGGAVDHNIVNGCLRTGADILAAVRAGIIDAEREMGKIKTPVTKDDKLQEQREALQEERVRAIVADEQRKQAAKAAKEQGK